MGGFDGPGAPSVANKSFTSQPLGRCNSPLNAWLQLSEVLAGPS